MTFHTEASWDAFITHSEYMRRKFDTVIKTDVLFTDNPQMVEEAKSQMRREEMWRDRWARISVPDRALTIGTLRYVHVPAPDMHFLHMEARKAVGKSHTAINRLQRAGAKVRLGVQLAGVAQHGASSMVFSRGTRAPTANADVDRSSIESMDSAGGMTRSDEAGFGVGGAWAEIVGAFFEEKQEVKVMFDTFKSAYLEDKGADSDT